MQTLQKGYNGLKLLVALNVDRVFVLTALTVALFLSAYIGSL